MKGKIKKVEKNVTISVGHTRLSGTIVAPGGAARAPAILFIHGWCGKKDKYVDRARELAARGFVCLAMDLRGHGESDGDRETVTRAQHLKDVLAAYNFLAKYPGVDKSQIGVFGASYGCYLAMLLSSRKKVAWLALRAPATYRDAGFATRSTAQAVKDLGDYRRRPVASGRNMALKALRSFTGDVLVIAGERDEYVPTQTIVNVMAACRNTGSAIVETIAGADHNLSDPEWRVRANGIVDQWIAKVTRKKAN